MHYPSFLFHSYSDPEYERMRGFLPDPTQNPEQFKAQLKIFTQQYQQLLNDKVDSAFKARRDRSPDALKTVAPSYEPAERAAAPAPAKTRQGQVYQEPKATVPQQAPPAPLKTPKGNAYEVIP